MGEMAEQDVEAWESGGRPWWQEQQRHRYLPDELPMIPHHQRLVMEGSKTTTMRGKQVKPGIYNMTSGSGLCLGVVEVVSVSDTPLYWFNLDWQQQDDLARTEGYAHRKAFANGVKKIPGGHDFIDGKRSMYVHIIRPHEVQN